MRGVPLSKFIADNSNYSYLAQQWDAKKNLKTIDEITYGTKVKYWWICAVNHSFQASPDNRTKGRGCPYCSGRLVDTNIFNVAKNFPNSLSYWSAQNRLDPRSAPIKNKYTWVCEKGHTWELKARNNLSCPYCNLRKLLKGFNDLATTHGEYAKMLSVSNKIKPDEIMSNSKLALLWNCEFNHEYTMIVRNKISYNRGCTICSSQEIVKGVNDFSTKNAHLYKQWDKEKNGIDFAEIFVKPSSNEKAWWICNEEHSWLASYASRNKGSGCRVCNGKEIIVGLNDLASQKPELAKASRNINPIDFFAYSTKPILIECQSCNNDFEEIPARINLPHCQNCRANRSTGEIELYQYVQSVYDGIIIQSFKNYAPYEIDIFLPELSIGFEYNGDYWHSDEVLMKNLNMTAEARHKTKLSTAENNGAVLYFIWESDWHHNPHTIKTAINSLLNKEQPTDCSILQILSKG